MTENTTFAELLKARRRTSYDATTGQPYTQQRLADELTRISGVPIARSSIATWERGMANPKPVHIAALAKVPGLELSVSDVTAALGLDVDQMPLTQQERELLAAFRRLRKWPALQQTALRVVRALRPVQQDQ